VVSSPLPKALADQQTVPSTAATRTASLDIKVVLIGFDEGLIDEDYLNWNSPAMRYQLFQIPGLSTNTEYSLSYEYVFPGKTFTDEFVQYLQSVGKAEQRQNVIWNISYSKIRTSYFWNYTHFAAQSVNTYYPADGVETWLAKHESDYGGFPKNGYVLVLADLSSRLPSATPTQFELAIQRKDTVLTPHFYNKTYVDSDLGIVLNRRYMTAWGGHSRLFFADLSAGPEQTAEQLPIQIAYAVDSVDVSTTYGKTWANQFLSDYISGAVYNLFTPDFVYPINFSYSYKIKVVVIDNRTDGQDPYISSTFDPDTAVKEWQALLPWANVTAETRYVSISDYPDLQRIVVEAKSPARYGSQPDSPFVDARPVWYWLSEQGQGHIKDFMNVTRDLDEFDIPVFAFAFTGDCQFGFTFKESVAKDFDRTIWGVALYDLVLISHSTEDLRRGDTWMSDPRQPGKGFGFTNTIIHEVGHMLGLMHPFATLSDPTENFVASVMAYYPYDYSFSIFDRDALGRGQADQLLRVTAQLLADTPSILINQGDISSARASAARAEESYSSMNYADAIENGLDALLSAARANSVGGGFIPSSAFGTIQVIGSFILGVLVTYLALRRRGRVKTPTMPLQAARVSYCPTCGKPLTWISEYSRWYCYNCRKYH